MLSPVPQTFNAVEVARKVVEDEILGLEALRDSLSESVAEAVQILLSASGYCYVTGVGKSGHIARKVASTLASTGTPAFFVHPTEMSHGDLGALRPDGVIIAISNSGESRELRDMIVYCTRNSIPIIGITGNPSSYLARSAKSALVFPKSKEACPNGLAPTTSTTITLVLGDALAVAVMVARGFKREEFGLRHPGGTLGLELQRVSDWIEEARLELPSVKLDSDMTTVVDSISRGRYGCTAVVDESGALAGMITDGDLRRAMSQDFFDKRAKDIMTRQPFTVGTDDLMGSVFHGLVARRMSNVIIVSEGRPVAVIHIKDLMRAGFLA